MKTIATIIAAALALALQGAFAGAQAVNANGHCTGMTVTDYVSSDVNERTTSTMFVNITDGHLNFITSATGCVLITFAGVGNVFPPGGGLSEDLHVRTLLDGSNLCVPASTFDVFLQGVIWPPQAPIRSHGFARKWRPALTRCKCSFAVR